MTNTSTKKKFTHPLLSDPLSRAVLISPLAVIPVYLIYLIYAAFIEAHFAYYDGFVLGVLGSGIMVLIIAYLMTIFFGLPLILILRSIRILNLATVIMVGLLGSSIFSFSYYSMIAFWVGGGGPSVSDLLFHGSFSTAICIVFWLVYRQGNRS